MVTSRDGVCAGAPRPRWPHATRFSPRICGAKNRGQESEALNIHPRACSRPGRRRRAPPLRRAFSRSRPILTSSLQPTSGQPREITQPMWRPSFLATTIYGRPYVALNGEPLSALPSNSPHRHRTPQRPPAPRAAAPQAAASGTALCRQHQGWRRLRAASNANTGVGSAMNSSSGAFLQAETRARTPIFVAIEHRRGEIGSSSSTTLTQRTCISAPRTAEAQAPRRNTRSAAARGRRSRFRPRAHSARDGTTVGKIRDSTHKSRGLGSLRTRAPRSFSGTSGGSRIHGGEPYTFAKSMIRRVVVPSA